MEYVRLQSAQIGTLLFMPVDWRLGVLADRTQTTLWLVLSFIISFLGSLLLRQNYYKFDDSLIFNIDFNSGSWVYCTFLVFAVMENGQIPLALTGTAVGLVSLKGYTPDIFAGPAMGYLLDNSQGEQGHQHVLDVCWRFFYRCCPLWYCTSTKQEGITELQLIDTFKTKLNSNPKT
jgi:sugar phosphate permease